MVSCFLGPHLLVLRIPACAIHRGAALDWEFGLDEGVYHSSFIRFDPNRSQQVNWEQELNRAQQVNCHQITKELPCKIESMTDWRMTLPSLYLINVCKPHYSFLPAQVVTLVVFRVGELTEAVVPSRRIVLSSW